MDEAARIQKQIQISKYRRRRKSQNGQTIVEYLLVLILCLSFTRFVYFNKDFGFKAILDKTMLRMGSFLELNLKSGTKAGGDGQYSLDQYAGADTWSN